MKTGTLLLFVMVVHSHALETMLSLQVKYGEEPTRVKYEYFDAPDESYGVIRDFYCAADMSFLDDHNNEKILIVDKGTGKTRVLERRKKVMFDHVIMEDSVIFSGEVVYKIQDRTIVPLTTYFEHRPESFSFYLLHPRSGYHVVSTDRQYYFFDESYNLVDRDEVPASIRIKNGIFLSDEQACVDDNIPGIRESLRRHYEAVTGKSPTDMILPLFQFADSSEWGRYFKSSDIRLTLLGIDQSYNTYWKTNTRVVKQYEKT